MRVLRLLVTGLVLVAFAGCAHHSNGRAMGHRPGHPGWIHGKGHHKHHKEVPVVTSRVKIQPEVEISVE